MGVAPKLSTATSFHWSKNVASSSSSHPKITSCTLASPSSNKRSRSRSRSNYRCLCTGGIDQSSLFGKTHFTSQPRTLNGSENSIPSISNEEYAKIAYGFSKIGRTFTDFDPGAAAADDEERQEAGSSSGSTLADAIMERKANSVDVPITIRVLQRKRQLTSRFKKAGESVSCSAEKAFSCLVLIIQELQSYTLVQMKELLVYDDLKGGCLKKVQREIQATFVWMFEQIFSHTPTLMFSVMILLANFSLHSMLPLQQSYVLAETAEGLDSSALKELESGGKVGPVEVVSDDGELKVDFSLWEMMVEEAFRMKAKSADRETRWWSVMPTTVQMEEEYAVYGRTEQMYRRMVAEDPPNAIFLSNYAQFLYLVLHNHDRADEYFKRAIQIDPNDAMSLSWYANFVWLALKDEDAAEEMFLQAIEASSHSEYHISNYANFLWQTTGDKTSFLILSSNEENPNSLFILED